MKYKTISFLILANETVRKGNCCQGTWTVTTTFYEQAQSNWASNVFNFAILGGVKRSVFCFIKLFGTYGRNMLTTMPNGYV
jgi:hypothetical protein